MPLTETQAEILEGLMLGDGHLSIGGRAKNPRLRINRSTASQTYAEWIASAFEEFTTPKSLRTRNIFDKRYGKTYGRISFCTRRVRAFIPAFSRWYTHREKHVPRDIELTPITIAVWLADDGSVYRRKCGGIELNFATCGFPREEAEFLADLLNAKFDEGFEVYGGYKGRMYYNIKASTRAARRLLEVVDPVFPPHPKRMNWADFRSWLANPRCSVCQADAVFKNGLYTGRGTIPLAQRYKCGRCGFCWKEGLKATSAGTQTSCCRP